MSSSESRLLTSTQWTQVLIFLRGLAVDLESDEEWIVFVMPLTFPAPHFSTVRESKLALSSRFLTARRYIQTPRALLHPGHDNELPLNPQ